MNRSVFYAHAGSGNHGCEAIVRSSTQILGESVMLWSANPDQDKKYGLDAFVEIRTDANCTLKRFGRKWFVSRLQTKLSRSIEKEIYYRKEDMLSSAEAGDIWLSIGGDNYCYPGTEVLAAENSILAKRGVKTVLWGCSVEPRLTEQPEIAADLAGYSLITARESISYEALKRVNPNTVLFPDPAFTLPKAELPLPAGWKPGNMAGINASPLILQSAKNGDLAFEAYCRLMQAILDRTDLGIALIPHVVWAANDDREPLQRLYDRFAGSGRVILLEDHNCMELKGYIARCRFFIGARTHATIAAYSSGVPTLVLGYSVKSRGIARDLFGTEEHYVLPVQELSDADALAEGFAWLSVHEDGIRGHLAERMPGYIQNAYAARECLNGLR